MHHREHQIFNHARLLSARCPYFSYLRATYWAALFNGFPIPYIPIYQLVFVPNKAVMAEAPWYGSTNRPRAITFVFLSCTRRGAWAVFVVDFVTTYFSAWLVDVTPLRSIIHMGVILYIII